MVLVALAGAACGSAVLAGSAQAHSGPANPVASSYVARISSLPAGIEGSVLGGDLRMWLRLDSTKSVVVLDYRGAPYLRFLPSGVDVNTNSALYYLNQPTPLRPPGNLTPSTPPRWERASFGQEYSWHDGRLHALAAVALTPGQRFVGRWSIPLLIGGRRTAIEGVLWHAGDPSIVWFWPILVLLVCLVAIGRIGSRAVDKVVAYALALTALASIAVLTLGHELYGEPFVSVGQMIFLAIVLAFVAALLAVVLLRGPDPVSLIVILVAALWDGLEFLPTLLHGFVLMAVPTFLARAATVACLATGAGMVVLLFGFRFADLPEQFGERPEPLPLSDLEDFDARESLA